MEILTVTAENLFCFGKLDIKFDDYGQLTLIEGRNLDATVAESNGAGKTSIYEAILWIYYGITKKGLTGNDVINERMAPGGICFGESKFIQGGMTYYIKRSRNGECKLMLKSSTSDLTKGTEKETQDMLESIIKMSPLTFSKMTYFGQEDIKSFAGLSDRELKVVFEQALGVEFISNDHEKVKVHLKNKQAEKEALAMSINSNQAKVDAFEEKIGFLKKADAELKDRQRKEIERLETELINLNGRYIVSYSTEKEMKDMIATKRPVYIQYKDDFKKLFDIKAGLSKQIANIETKITKSKLMAGMNEDDRARTMKSYSDAEKSIGQSCDACDREFTEQDIAKYKKKLSEKFNEFVTEKARLSEETATTIQAMSKLQDLATRLDIKLDIMNKDMSDIEKELSAHTVNLGALEREIKGIETEVSAKNNLIKSLSTKKTGYSDDISYAEKEMAALQENIRQIQADIDLIENELNIINLLRLILSDGGLKNYIFNSITPELNRTANEYLNVLEDIEVEITTVKQLKSGEFRDKFDIVVDNHSGSAKYKGNSGGERRKIDFAISLAFNSVVRSMSEESCNILFLDEPFESLDEASSERAVELIEKITSGTKAFLIAHNQYIKDLTFETMMIEKKDGFSAIKACILSK